MKRWVVCVAFLLALSERSVAARELSFEERVTAQKAIEQVYWSHRIWPRENNSAKPPLASVLSDDAIRSKVDDTMRASGALGALYGRSITASQLQAEMDRFSDTTRDPALLREMFAALGDDPFVIAECLARPNLADRMIRNGYARDDRFHAALRLQAEAALAGSIGAESMKLMGAQYAEVTWRLGAEGDEGGTPFAEDGNVVALTVDEWNAKVRQLAALYPSAGAPPDCGSGDGLSSGCVGPPNETPGLPLNVISPLQESNTEFFATAVIESGPDHVKTATVSWAKQTFDAWWAQQRSSFSNVWSVPEASYTLALPRASNCARDSWSPIRSGVPEARAFHTAVWTGVEMIVWSGGVGDYLQTGGRYNPATDTWMPTSVGANVPPGRLQHTAVWTGTEMIVWGGYGLVSQVFTNYNTGGRYNPATDTWAPTRVDATTPDARKQHTAVWTGAEMIVWGGSGSGGDLDNGGRYNPITDSWTRIISGPNGPGRSWGHTAVWTGTEMIIWGVSSLRSGSRYNPATDTWVPTGTGAGVPASRFSHLAVWTGSEMIVWGGLTGAGSIWTSTGGRYNPSTDSWAPTSTGASVPVGVTSATAVWADGEMIVWGAPAGTGARYSPLTDSWRPMSSGPGAASTREFHTAVWTGSEMIVWGGRAPTTLRATGTGGRYDPMTDRWAPTGVGAEIPTPRVNHTAVWTGSEMIVWGGGDTWPPVNTGGRYVPATDAWSPTSIGSGVPVARREHVAVWTGREMIVWGGDGAIPGFYSDGGRYDPVNDTWRATTTIAAPIGRFGPTAVWTGRELIVWGGYDTVHQNTYTNTGGRYDPLLDRWQPTFVGASIPQARLHHTAVWTGDEMLVWGGSSARNTVGDRYDPATNTWRAMGNGAGVPSFRTGHSAIWTGSAMLLFGGGANNAYLNSGARYDPTNDGWSPIDAGTGVPSGRSLHTAIWTGAEMIVWGGTNGATELATGGRYDPATNRWTPTSTGANAPLAHIAHTAAWTGREMLVWGGQPNTSSSGAYCACPDGMLVYRDADGDGFGDPGVSLPSCDGTIPPGYAGTDSDCDDQDPSVHPGAPELCNGTDDDCDGIVDNGDDALCDDDNACTDDVCVGASGCAHTNNVSPCNDDNACTAGDTCGGGHCNPGGPTNCDDGICCTVDSCNPATGCVHSANEAAPVFTRQPSLGNTILWPPNHGYVDFSVGETGAAAASACGMASIQFASCSSSQPENGTGTGDGNTRRDCVYEPGALHLRAERDGACSPIGRVYQTNLIAVDVCGNVTSSDVFSVNVWHERAHPPAQGATRSSTGNTQDVRNGTNGTYGAECGAGSPSANGTTHDLSDADPEMEISQEAAVSVDTLAIGKASGGNAELSWTDPTLLSATHVKRYHVYRLDPANLFWTQIAELPQQSLSYLDPSLNDRIDWQYKVTAVIK